MALSALFCGDGAVPGSPEQPAEIGARPASHCVDGGKRENDHHGRHFRCDIRLGDMKVAMAMSILKTIAGTGQLSEMYSIDFNEDICIIGHSGSGDADISQAKKPSMKIVDVFHGKTGGGYLTQFYPPVGDVTYLGITQDKDGHFKFVAAEGVNEDGPIFTFGDTNMRTRFSIGAREFCNRWSEAGPTHHMAAAVGHHIDTILKVAKILDVPVDVVCR